MRRRWSEERTATRNCRRDAPERPGPPFGDIGEWGRPYGGTCARGQSRPDSIGPRGSIAGDNLVCPSDAREGRGRQFADL